jgi:hypothetical protein
MDGHKVRINLRYEQDDLKSLFRYASAHNVERDGRYDLQSPLVIDIWTHNWRCPACKAESTLMFRLEFDWNTASLMSVTLQTGFGWKVFHAELTRLERAALGDVVYGRRRCEPTI